MPFSQDTRQKSNDMMRTFLITKLCVLLIFAKAHAEFSGYYLSRAFLDVKKDNPAEDIFELRQRIFTEFSGERGRARFTLSARTDLNWFEGKFSRVEFSFRPFEFYALFDFDRFSVSFGRQVVSWGKTDGSPFDVINRPDITEGFFTEQRFVKVPSILLNFSTFFDDSNLQVVYEPFFTPPDFLKVNSDWALLNWSSIARSRAILEDDERIKAVLNGTFDPFLEEYPEKLTELLLSFGLGVRFDTLFGETGVALYLYTGYEQFPTIYFNEGFRADLATQPGNPIDNLSTIDVAEVVIPVAQGENFLVLRPSRFWIAGIGIEREIFGFLAKADIGGYFDTSALDPFLNVVEHNFAVGSVQIEKQFSLLGFDVFPVFGVKSFIPVPQRELLIFEKGLFVPSLLVRAERWIFARQFTLISAFAWDFPRISRIARSFITVQSVSFSLTDNLTLTAGVLLMEGKRISLFGFFKENSALFLNVRLSF